MAPGTGSRNRLVRAAFVVLCILVALAVLASAGVWGLLAASRTPRQGERVVAGLDARVEIRFDARARPFVRATTLGDALFAEGFLHARERLWQMELLRRAGRGRLSQALGPDLLESDRELWRVGVPQLAARLEERASPATRERVGRYVAGVNAGLDSLAVRPPELLLADVAVRPWEPRDVYALGALMAFDSANNLENELLRAALAERLEPPEMAAFLPGDAPLPGVPTVLPGAAAGAGAGGRADAPAPAVPRSLATLARLEALDARRRRLLPALSLGSNGWVVAPERSRSGRALFAFDSHDALALPNLFYEVHLFFGEGRELRGWSVPGLVGVVNGFSERHAWGFTNIGDTQDLFLERRHPQDPHLFADGPDWVRARAEEVEIPVRGRAEPERLTVLHTHHGPLVQEDPPLALAWTAHRLDEHGLGALLDLGLARDWDAFRDALDRFAAPSANVTYADVDGRVAFRTVGLLPVRGRGRGLAPLPGDDPATAWRGRVPADALPRRVDPPEGFVAAANAQVQPPGATPRVSADNAPGYRMRRITRVLAARRDHDPASMRALQMDWRDGKAELVLPVMLRALRGASWTGTAAQALARLEAWRPDPVDAPDRAAPLVFQRWWIALAREVFAERLGDALWERLLRHAYVLDRALDGLLLEAPHSPWWRGDREARLRSAFRRAVDGLAAELGADPAAWRWDARHAVHLRHELGGASPLLGRWLHRGPFPWGGGSPTVGRAASGYDRPALVDKGATVRVVAEMARPLRVWAVIPGGQSGHPADPHYDDQTAAWLDGASERLAAEPEALESRPLVLEPGEG